MSDPESTQDLCELASVVLGRAKRDPVKSDRLRSLRRARELINIAIKREEDN